MKTFQLATTTLIVMSIMMGCQKNNFIADADTVNTNAGTNEKAIDPANFVEGITNPYLSFIPGDTFFYQNVAVDSGDTTIEDIYVTNTGDIKVILGVNCSVIHDQVMSGGIITEDTYDWYAQDIHGNVWYFGESTMALQDDGTFTREGSFEAGVDGAKAGIVMWGNPQAHIHETYRQEFYKGHAEDQAEIRTTNATITIGLGIYTHCIKTAEFTILEPGVIENKWYAPGVGQILTTVTKGGDEHEELIGMN